MLLASFVGTASNIAVPVLEEEFAEAGLATVSWVVTGFNVAQVTFMLLGGRLADRIGRQTIFLRGRALFGIGALLSGVVPTIEFVIATRILQAIGASFMLPASLTAVLPDYPAERHGVVVSWWSAMGIFGAAVAPTVAAAILDLSGWRAVFLSAAPIALLALIAGHRVLQPGSRAEDPAPLDLVGTATGTLALGGLVFAIVQGRVWGWLDPRIVGIALFSVAAAATFVRSSLRHPEPLLDFGLWRIPTFAATTVATAAVSASTTASWFLYPLFMNEVWDYSNLEIGLAMTPGPAILVLMAPLGGSIGDRIGYFLPLVIGATFATLGTAWMAWQLAPGASYAVAFLPGTLGIGIGMGLMLGPANAAALSNVASELAAGSIGIAVCAAIVSGADAGERVGLFRTSWWTMVAVMALGPALLWMRYPRTR